MGIVYWIAAFLKDVRHECDAWSWRMARAFATSPPLVFPRVDVKGITGYGHVLSTRRASWEGRGRISSRPQTIMCRGGMCLQVSIANPTSVGFARGVEGFSWERSLASAIATLQRVDDHDVG